MYFLLDEAGENQVDACRWKSIGSAPQACQHLPVMFRKQETLRGSYRVRADQAFSRSRVDCGRAKDRLVRALGDHQFPEVSELCDRVHRAFAAFSKTSAGKSVVIFRCIPLPA
ncbi:hypothetical protein [Actinoplanes sp. NPDC051494]|uniref:hypothetical protein n=1 Tax=Actinoplanes sp. NPDC051494 TaxID=3363907 RepID=UPI003798E497